MSEEPRMEVVERLAEARVTEPLRDPLDVVPDATHDEVLLAEHEAGHAAETWANALTDAGLLGRPRTPLDLTPRELVALTGIFYQVQPWLLSADARPLSDVLKVVTPRVAENVAFLMHWARWIEAPDARFRLQEDCDD